MIRGAEKLYSGGSLYNFGFEQAQIQIPRGEKSPKSPEDIRKTILGAIKERNSPSYDNLINQLEMEFGSDDPQKKVELVIAGLTKVGKSSFIEGLLAELPNILNVPVLYHCFEHSRKVAYDLGVIKSPVGEIRVKEYKKIPVIDDGFVRLFNALNGRFLLIREAILLTEDIDPRGKVIGVPRGSLAGVRERIRLDFPVKIVFLTTKEEFRRENVTFWESMRLLPAEKILEEEARAGVWDDTSDPDKVKEKYETANAKASWQQIFALVANTFTIIQQYKEWGKSYDGTEIDELTLPALANLVRKYPQVFDRLKERATRRIVKELFGDPRTFNVCTLENVPLPPDCERSASRSLHESHLLMTELQRQSQKNQVIREQMEKWKRMQQS